MLCKVLGVQPLRSSPWAFLYTGVGNGVVWEGGKEKLTEKNNQILNMEVRAAYCINLTTVWSLTPFKIRELRKGGRRREMKEGKERKEEEYLMLVDIIWPAWCTNIILFKIPSRYTRYVENIDPVLEMRKLRLRVWDLNPHPSIPRTYTVFNLV